MEWQKEGLLFSPAKTEWADNSALQPTPIILGNKVRVYVGMRDKNGVSRIGYVDLDINNPCEILKISDKPVLDIGKDGMFDENGVVPTSIVNRDGILYLYYAGYAVGQKVRFYVFTGLSVSKDGGETFQRIKQIPVTDRVENEEFFRVIHSTIYDNGIWKVWYGAGNSFERGATKTLAVYDIRYMESADGINFPDKGVVSIQIPEGCHRVGRPYVFKEFNLFKMFYGYGSENIPYQLAYSESMDGINWMQKEVNLPLSEKGWDSEMMAYPSFVRIDGQGFLFYNGNNYGYDGFGLAKLISE